MGTIIGNGFKDFVLEQINIRQEKLGLTDSKSDDILKYTTSKTSWVRLSSGIDIDDSKAKELGVKTGYHRAELARNFPLYSTWFPKNNETTPGIGFTSGVGYSPSNEFASSYGFNSDATYGLVPPPGITSVDVKSLNRGSLREANIQIRCHNLFQFKIIETLYLRLGYSILLEWGHTLWFNNKGELKNDIPNDVYSRFLKGQFDQSSILDALEEQRLKYDGNYDGFFGVVVNFDWELLNDGGYNINIRCRSVGDVIESLKLNLNLPFSGKGPVFTIKSTDGEELTPDQIKEAGIPQIVSDAGRSSFHYLLWIIRKIIIDRSGESNPLNPASLTTHQINLYSNYVQGTSFRNETDFNNLIRYRGFSSGYKVLFPNLIDDASNYSLGGEYQYYVSLGVLLRTIENFLGYNTTSGTNNDVKPLFYIDYDFDNNVCFTIPRQLSVDPKVCLIAAASQKQIESVESFVSTKAPNFIKVYKITEKLISTSAAQSFNNLILEQIVTEDPIIGSEQLTILPPGVELNKEYKKTLIKEVAGIPAIEQTIVDIYYDKDSLPEIKNPDDERIWQKIFNSIENALEEIGILEEEKTPSTSILDKISGGGGSFRTNQPFIGKTMNILVNLDYIVTSLDGNFDSEGKVSIFSFLKTLMGGIQTALGSINDFEIIYTAETNTFSIIDNTFIPDIFEYLQKEPPKIAKFNPNLLKPNYGSFTTSVSIKSQLDNKFTTAITIGAQANGNKVGENATAFSRWNQGLTDRIITTKQTFNDPNKSTTNTTGSQSPEEVYVDGINKLFEFRVKINDGIITSEDIDNNRQSIVDLLNYEVGYFVEQEIIPGIGFIPLNLQLEVDGLSGIRIYEVYSIDDTLLPENYKNKIQFITKGVSHKIDNNGWKTTLESISGPKPIYGAKKLKSQVIEPSKTSTTNVAKAEQIINNNGCPKTYYSDKPIAEYVKTTITDEEVMKILKRNFSKEVALATFMMMKNEQPGTGGIGFKGFNNNYGGVQTDSSRWEGDISITGRLCLKEGGTGKPREFASFDSAEDSIKFKATKIRKKGIYIGGIPKQFKDNPYYNKVLTNVAQVATTYGYEWIRSEAGVKDGRWQRNPFVSNMESYYKKAEETYNRV
jgi:hypothetical protein